MAPGWAVILTYTVSPGFADEGTELTINTLAGSVGCMTVGVVVGFGVLIGDGFVSRGIISLRVAVVLVGFWVFVGLAVLVLVGVKRAAVCVSAWRAVAAALPSGVAA